MRVFSGIRPGNRCCQQRAQQLCRQARAPAPLRPLQAQRRGAQALAAVCWQVGHQQRRLGFAARQHGRQRGAQARAGRGPHRACLSRASAARVAPPAAAAQLAARRMDARLDHCVAVHSALDRFLNGALASCGAPTSHSHARCHHGTPELSGGGARGSQADYGIGFDDGRVGGAAGGAPQTPEPCRARPALLRHHAKHRQCVITAPLRAMARR